MHHMTLALNEDIDWSRVDPRVKPCIADFLKVRMVKYAKTHMWRFDESDFDALAGDTPLTAADLQGLSAGRLRALARQRSLSTVGLTEKADFVRLLAATRDDLRTFKVGPLRRMLKKRGISVDGLLEKDELVEAFFQAPAGTEPLGNASGNKVQ
jgi:hypothetical protein